MCGRFNIDFEDSKELEQIVHTVDQKICSGKYGAGAMMKIGEIYPTNSVPILCNAKDWMDAELSFWGFPQYTGKGVIINARAESAETKPTFRESLNQRRCIIPSSGFYEWNPQKKKFAVKEANRKELFMAGLYRQEEEEATSRFVILTTQANESMKVIHSRMPVILEHQQIEQWLGDGDGYKKILQAEMPELVLTPMEQQYEQMSLF